MAWPARRQSYRGERLAAANSVRERRDARGQAMRVIIAGAGVGGLALALMLQRRGIDAVIYEQASEVRELGVGINTLPTAIRELSEIGLLPALDLAGIRTRELIYLNRQGQEVWRELRGIDGGHPLPQFSIHRGRCRRCSTMR